MTRDDIAPLGDSEAFPCPSFGGSGLEDTGNGDVILCKTRCDFCGGSGVSPDVRPELPTANPANLTRVDSE